MAADPPVIDNTLPGDLPPDQTSPVEPNQDLPHEIRQEKIKTPLDYLKVLYPKYFSPNPVDPEVIEVILEVSRMARPSCLNFRMQNIAQAYYAAYLIEEHLKNTSVEDGGTGGAVSSGVILSEKEGDIQVTYAPISDANAGAGGDTTKPSDAWGKWKNLMDLCTRGAITTRFGQQGTWTQEPWQR